MKKDYTLWPFLKVKMSVNYVMTIQIAISTSKFKDYKDKILSVIPPPMFNFELVADLDCTYSISTLLKIFFVFRISHFFGLI